MMVGQEAAPTLSRLSLVLLPGLDGTGRLFDSLLDVLPRELDPIIVSFPSAINQDYAALEAHVAGVLPLDRPFVLLGESFSGPLALRLAARGSANLAAIILVASFIVRPVAWLPSVARYLVHPVILRLPGRSLLMRWLLFGKKPPAALVDRAMRCVGSVEPAVLACRIKAALAVDATDAFMRCAVPMLYLGGAQDRLVSSQTAQRLKALRPDLAAVMVDAPHFVLQRAPVAAVSEIVEFLLRCGLLD
jgi:pimeloyl-[acyl-carrier protein] methyl ester esterase